MLLVRSICLALCCMSVARAECPSTLEEIRSLTVDVKESFESLDLDGFHSTLRELGTQLECLSEVADPADAAVVHRLKGIAWFVLEDKDKAASSLAIASALDPSFVPSESVAPKGGELWDLFQSAQKADTGRRYLVKLPKDMIPYVNGEPTAIVPDAVPVLFQVKTKDGQMYWSGYLDAGAPLPDWIVTGDDVFEEFVTPRLPSLVALRAILDGTMAELEEGRAAQDAEQLKEIRKILGLQEEEEQKLAFEAFAEKYKEASVEVDDVAYRNLCGLESLAATAPVGLTVEDLKSFTDAVMALRSKATADWAKVFDLIENDEDKAWGPLNQFISDYQDATVVFKDAEFPVVIFELDDATYWLALHTWAQRNLPKTSDILARALPLANQWRLDEEARVQAEKDAKELAEREEAERKEAARLAARTPLERCEEEEGDGCLEFARSLDRKEVKAGRSQIEWMMQACLYGDVEGCDAFAAEAVRTNTSSLVAEVVDQCQADDAAACRLAGEIQRRNSKKDAPYGAALLSFARGCRLGDDKSCTEAANFRRVGTAKKIDAGPDEHWKNGCDNGMASACAQLGVSLINSKNSETEGLQLLEESCELGSGLGCTKIGQLTKKNTEEEIGFYEQGCALGDGLGCYLFAEQKRETRHIAPADDTYPRYVEACDGAEPRGCIMVADAHSRTKSAWDQEERYRRTEQACNMGSVYGATACLDQAKMLKQGRGVEKDRASGKALQKAYSKKQPTRYLRLMVGTGLPAPVALGAEGVAPLDIPVGISVFGELSTVKLSKDGLLGGLADTDGGFQYGVVMGRLYLSHRAVGPYVAGGYSFGNAWLSEADMTKEDQETFSGPTFRLGLTGQGGWLISGFEAGITQSPAAVEEVLQLAWLPTVAIRFGVAPL